MLNTRKLEEEDKTYGTHNMKILELENEIKLTALAVSSSPFWYQRTFLNKLNELEARLDFLKSYDDRLRTRVLGNNKSL